MQFKEAALFASSKPKSLFLEKYVDFSLWSNCTTTRTQYTQIKGCSCIMRFWLLMRVLGPSIIKVKSIYFCSFEMEILESAILESVNRECSTAMKAAWQSCECRRSRLLNEIYTFKSVKTV